jgi:hypothetical protein
VVPISDIARYTVSAIRPPARNAMKRVNRGEWNSSTIAAT